MSTTATLTEKGRAYIRLLREFVDKGWQRADVLDVLNNAATPNQSAADFEKKVRVRMAQ